jgi:hypothetical protein
VEVERREAVADHEAGSGGAHEIARLTRLVRVPRVRRNRAEVLGENLAPVDVPDDVGEELALDVPVGGLAVAEQAGDVEAALPACREPARRGAVGAIGRGVVRKLEDPGRPETGGGELAVGSDYLKARGSVSPDSPRSETHQCKPDHVGTERGARGRARDKRNPEREGKSETHDQPQTDKGEQQRHSADDAPQLARSNMDACG